MYKEYSIGKLQFLYAEGTIRKIKTKVGTELLRAVYPAVRDKNWGTVPFSMISETIEQNANQLLISCKVEFCQNEIVLEAGYEIVFNISGEIRYAFSAKAKSAFLKNRIGLNILLPIEGVMGQKFVSKNTDTTNSDIFPELISPHQPLKDICNLSWTDVFNNKISIKLEGDLFEMEDQRNWTDASYKIYSTPLELPFPVAVEAGEQINQKIVIKTQIPEDFNAIPLKHRENQKSFKFPVLSLGMPEKTEKHHPEEIDLIKLSGFKYFTAFFDLSQKDRQQQLVLRLNETRLLGAKCKLIFISGLNLNSEDTETLIKTLESYSTEIHSVEFHSKKNFISDKSQIAQIIQQTRKKLPKLKIGGGTYAYYAELNRAKKLTKDIDFLSFSICPQVHAFDNLTLIENLAGIRYVALDAQKKSNLPLHISAISLKQRMNFVATDKDKPKILPQKLPDNVDERQQSIFAALWTIGCVKNLAIAGVNFASFYQTKGQTGIFQSKYPEKGYGLFSEIPLQKYPVFYILKELLKYKKEKIEFPEHSENESIDSMIINYKEEKQCWLWNYSSYSQQITTKNKMQSFHKAEAFNFETGCWEKNKMCDSIKSYSLIKLI